MENRIIFRELLSGIKEAADASGGVITKDEIRDILKDIPLEEAHFSLIYEYLAGQNIRVAEDGEEKEQLPAEEGGGALAIYLEDLERLARETNFNERELLLAMREGAEDARERLIESYLPLICRIAGEYEEEEIPAEDLIQEGNLGLLTALASMGEYTSIAACRAHILNCINEAVEQAIRSARESSRGNAGVLSRVNHLNEAVKNLERDLEHRVSAEELSAYLEMPLQEIRDILTLSGDQIELDGN